MRQDNERLTPGPNPGLNSGGEAPLDAPVVGDDRRGACHGTGKVEGARCMVCGGTGKAL